jgi:chemotaxis signal transduction protein
MFLGVDLQNEEETFKFWYSEDFDLVRFKMDYKYGVQVSQVAEIVKFTI